MTESTAWLTVSRANGNYLRWLVMWVLYFICIHLALIAHSALPPADSDLLQLSPEEISQLNARYVKFDTYHPAVRRGLPVTRVISRTVLQRILAEKCEELAGKDVIENGTHVVDFEEKVRLMMSWSCLSKRPCTASLQGAEGRSGACRRTPRLAGQRCMP